MAMWLLPMPVILMGTGSCSGGGMGRMSDMLCPAPMDLHCADAWSAPKARRAARKNADERDAARLRDEGKRKHRMEEIVSETSIGGHPQKSAGRGKGLRAKGGPVAALD